MFPETIDHWANTTLATPVQVHYRALHRVLSGFIMIFFFGITVLMIVANGFTSTTILLLALNALLLVILYFIWRRAGRRAAYVFDLFGVTRGDNQRLSWKDLKSVDYRMAIKDGGQKESLWRIELVFTTGEAWIIPQRVQNLEEINTLINSLPVTHQKRPA